MQNLTEDMLCEYLEHDGNLCPYCGSIDISSAGPFHEGSQKVRCDDCEETWRDVWQLVGVDGAIERSAGHKSPEYKPVLKHEVNFETLKKVFSNRNVALMEVEVVDNVLFTKGDRVAAVVAVLFDGLEYHFTPFCLFMNGNPFELLKMVEPEGDVKDAVPEED